MVTFKEYANKRDIASAVAGQQAVGDPQRIMLVGSKTLDARISSVGVEQATQAMKRAVDQILSDEEALVQTITDEGRDARFIPWGRLYYLASSNKSNGVIEIEYNKQVTKNVIGDLGYTLGWLNKNWMTRPFRMGGEKMGLLKNPEKYYKMQFERELRRLANQNILLGLEEWHITTSYLGRNIYLRAKNIPHQQN